METRKGKHKDGNVRMGIYVDPFKKAVAVYLAELDNQTMTEIIWDGIKTVAQRKGVLLQDGTIAPEHKAAIETAVEVIKANNQVRG